MNKTKQAPKKGAGNFKKGSPSSRGRGKNFSRSRGQKRTIKTFDPSQFINKNPVEQKTETYVPTHDFTQFGFSTKLSQTVIDSGIVTPSPIQDQIIPHIMNDHDVIGLAETGTGKTAAFLLPLIEKTSHNWDRQTLVLTPTRELALQIDEELKKLGKAYKIYSTVCVGGTGIRPQINSLKRRKNQFIIGTPGRIIDLLERKVFRPELVSTVVLDEADRMLDMGFIKDMRTILENTPADRETLFFSATMSREIETLVHDFLRDPITVSVKKRDVTASIVQDVVPHTKETKLQTLIALLKQPESKRVIVFGNMKHAVERLSKDLNKSGIKTESIHGNKSHPQRQRALKNFKSGQAQVLCATDVAARGIHVDNVTHVINYDLPVNFEEYVHRIGRTGRGTKRGIALTFVPGKK